LGEGVGDEGVPEREGFGKASDGEAVELSDVGGDGVVRERTLRFTGWRRKKRVNSRRVR
jgi:hypothetical protein